MSNLTPDVINFDLSTVSGFETSAAGCYAHVLHHPNHVAGVTPWVIWRHGGALAAGDAWACFPNGGTMNVFFTYLFNSVTTSFSIISLGTPQYTNAQGTSNVEYIGTITNSSTGVTALTTPSNYDKFEAALQAAINQFCGAADIILSAASAGCFLAQIAMARSVLSSQIKGYLGYYPIPDVRNVSTPNGGYKLHPSVITGLFGTPTIADWNSVSEANKRLASWSWLLANGEKDTPLDCLFVYDRAGSHIKPLGSPGWANSAAHDSDQFDPLIDIARAAGLDVTVQIFAGRNFWETNASAAAVINAAAESWMAARAN